MISTVLLVFAFVLFVLAALGIPRPPDPASKYNLIGAGLAFLVAATLFGKFPNLP